MQSGAGRRLAALGAVLLVVTATLNVTPASAHRSPANCSGSNLTVGVFSDKPGGIRPGDTVTFSPFASNTNAGAFIACDVTGATVTATLPDGTTQTLATGVDILGGAMNIPLGTFSYTLPANSMANSITVQVAVVGTVHSPNGDQMGGANNPTNLPVIRPATTLTKTASAASVRTGSPVTYTFTEANTGNVDITGVSVTDSKCAPLIRGLDSPGNDDATLSPGEVFTYTCSRTLTLANADPGSNPPSVSNVATASGTVPADGLPAPAETSNAVVVSIRNPFTLLTKTRQGPATVPPGTAVTYTYTEQNTGTDPISSVVLTDDKCAPVTRGPDAPGNNDATLAPGETFTYTCTQTFNTVGTITNTVNATGTDTIDGQPAPPETAQATVTVARPQPSIATTASATGTTPGAALTDTATISNGANPGGTVTFRLYSDATCSTLVFTSAGRPVTATNATTGTATSAAYTTTAAGTYYWTAEYSGDANNLPAGPTPCQAANEQSTVNRTTPMIATTATPAAATAGTNIHDVATITNAFNPSGTVTFRLYSDAACTAQVFTSTNPVMTAGTPAVPRTTGTATSDDFPVGAPGTYHWTATYSGDANNTPRGPTDCLDPAETIGVGVAALSLTTRASGPVTVGNAISDTATISGGFVPTGRVTFDLFGPDNAACTGTPLFSSVKTVTGNGTYQSDSFIPAVAGTYRWVARYSGDANNPASMTPCADPIEQVAVGSLPIIAITKAATPPSRPVPGGTFMFDLVVTNTSSVALTIRSLTDNPYGDVTKIAGSTCDKAIGTVLAPSPGPGNTYSCQFRGDFSGPSGATQTDVVTVTATDASGNTVRASAPATVTITPVAPTITTTKSANPTSLPEPGGTFTFTYSVTDTGPEPVTVTSIVDDVYGNLNGRGTCATGVKLAASGGTYSCSFTGNFAGNAGARQVDTINTVGTNDRGQTVTSEARATVTITDVPPSIKVTKSPSPLSRPAPGGSFRFAVVVTNTSIEPVTTTGLVDDIYGDLNGRGSCGIGIVLAANGGSYSCAFDGDFRGKAGDSQTDTVTATAVDDEGTGVTAAAKATVTLTPVDVPPVIPPPPVVVQQQPPQVLVRTGSNAAGHARLAGILLLLGATLMAASWKFGQGGSGLLPTAHRSRRGSPPRRQRPLVR